MDLFQFKRLGVRKMMTSFDVPNLLNLSCTLMKGLIALCFSIAALGLQAQSVWPSRPIKLVVPFQAGSATDAATRVVANKMATLLSQPVVVDNRIGASGNIGSDVVAHAAADGYTILLGTVSTQVVGPLLNPSISYDSMHDFVPIGMMASSPYILVTSGSKGFKNFEELVREAKLGKGRVTYASAGVTSMGNLSAQLFSLAANIELSHIPYKSSAQSVTDTMSGVVDFQFSSVSPVLSQIKSGHLRALSVTSKSRLGILPDVPTVSESGYPGFEAVLWFGLFAPTNTPSTVIERLAKTLHATLQDPQVQRDLVAQGLQTPDLLGKDFQVFIKTEFSKWANIIKVTGVQAQ
jgi:tripartite-type tricarboxylate transporter receptor subunit TctC